MKKLAILCVLVMAISLVPAFAADTNNTTTTKKTRNINTNIRTRRKTALIVMAI